MKKFNDIVNENNAGTYDNKLAVEAIVKDYDFIRNTLLKFIKDNFNKVIEDAVDTMSDDSFNSSVLEMPNGDVKLKYLGVQFRIHEAMISKIDIVEYFTQLKESINGLILKDDAIMTSQGWYLRMQIDYDALMQSPLYKSLGGIKKFNL